MGRYHPKRLIVAAIVLCLIYLHVQHSQDDEFYTKTVKAFETQEKDEVWKAEVDNKVQQILQAQRSSSGSAASPTGILAPLSEPAHRLPPVPVPEFGNNANYADRQRPLADKPKYITAVGTSDLLPSKAASDQAAVDNSPRHHPRVRGKLDEIIHSRVIVIFSKSYCPYSRRAKTLLLETYDIVPRPYVVELDSLTGPADGLSTTNDAQLGDAGNEASLTMGQALQDLLGERTGRRTVPNIMVLGRSIGGFDEVEQLDRGDTLSATFNAMVGKRLERCQRKSS